MCVEQRHPAGVISLTKLGGKAGMIKPTINLQDLRRRIYVKAKAEKSWKFWGLYTHICKIETLETAYKMAKLNNGAAGIDGITFKDIEASDVQQYIRNIQEELITETYRPMRSRKQEIPKSGQKVKIRILSIPAIKDRIVQGAVKLILEPIFEADFQNGSYGYRPRKQAHEAISIVSKAILKGHTKVIDLDLKAYFDTIQHSILLDKVAARVQDAKILHLLKMMLKTSGKLGVAQGGTISPLLSNIYLNEVDKMLEKAKEVTREGIYEHISYARYADDIVILVDGYKDRWEWLEKAVYKRLQEELGKIKVEINNEKTRIIDLTKRETFKFLGFNFWYRTKTILNGKRGVLCVPSQDARNKLLLKLKDIFRRYRSKPTENIVSQINVVLMGWVNYFRIGNSTACFKYIKGWVERKIRRHLMRSCKRRGFGWKRWSTEWLYSKLGLYQDYGVRYANN